MATIIIISGNKNQGKSSLIKKIIKLLEQNNKTFAGFYAEKIIYDDLVFGYDMITLPKKKRFPFARTSLILPAFPLLTREDILENNPCVDCSS